MAYRLLAKVVMTGGLALAKALLQAWRDTSVRVATDQAAAGMNAAYTSLSSA